MPQNRKPSRSRAKSNRRGEGSRCRHCGCTEATPCTLYTIAVSFDGGRAVLTEQPCGWYKPDVCTAPPCVLTDLDSRWR